YRKQADEIRAVNPGQANWNDVGNFLLKYGNADDGQLAHFDSFQFQGEEIVAVDEQVPTISFRRQTYACGDTGGMIANDAEGKPALQLGLNLPEVQEVLRASFDPEKQTGLAFVKRPPLLDFLGDSSQVARLICFVRQTLRQERGIWFEEGIALHIYAVDKSGASIELDPLQRASLVRSIHNVPRVKEPNPSHFWVQSKEVEAKLIQELRRPSEDQIRAGIRFAVWPIAILTLVP
ncbi:MAG: hypothetical protein K2X81_01235, partial [Candidatus Obscuribacterales bacterium]|nr:hypothetical protein [Candidatus Obscuribacterales bacterium]